MVGLSPPVNLLTILRRCFFVDSVICMLHDSLNYTVLSVPFSLVITCCENANLLAFLYAVSLVRCSEIVLMIFAFFFTFLSMLG